MSTNDPNAKPYDPRTDPTSDLNTAQWDKFIKYAQQEYKLNDYRPNSITLNAAGDDEMLRVAKDGFYVRGVKVPADEQEAAAVYAAFKEWLTWNQLSRT